MKLEPMDEMPYDVMLSMEHEATGLYLSGHPTAQYQNYTKRIGSAGISDILSGRYEDTSRVNVLAMVSTVKTKQMKDDSVMAYVTAEDVTGSINITVFAKTFSMYRHILSQGKVLLISAEPMFIMS
jgi:DNA polymerase-3 subunit alpha